MYVLRFCFLLFLNCFLNFLLQALEAQQKNFKVELEKKNLSEEQVKLLLDQHNQDREILERNMDSERSRQISTLADKIAEKKRKKLETIAKRHEADLQQHLVKENKDRNELSAEQVFKILCKIIS